MLPGMSLHFYHAITSDLPLSVVPSARWLFLFLLLLTISTVQCLSTKKVDQLRLEAVDLFYHGFDNYMTHAFPEDELRPLSCRPLTRDRTNPSHFEVNDVLGNYSLTLVDNLSTLAILASSPPLDRNPLLDFQNSIVQLVDLYGDGSNGPTRIGKRAIGFDLDSKVQVFETVIRGVGGLVSAHLFAVGELPIRGYSPEWIDVNNKSKIRWPNGFIYNGQLLRLAKDLAQRLLPAFSTPTGIPYPRVNLRTGIPFYAKRHKRGPPLEIVFGEEKEVTETCSAGAGSLVLELATLSRLTGDSRFELAAKRAFWAIWERRTPLDLIGSGIDAETGAWIETHSGIGAGIDSFFEYAFKTSILLSDDNVTGLSADGTSPNSYMQVFDTSLKAINKHLYRRHFHKHPHFIQGDLGSGSVRAFWMDSLSAYYPGLLALAGEIEQATESHMLFAAIWTRYSALPERWSASTQEPEGGLHWWGGRPEFIESTWYLHQATKDPWYLAVGEMVLQDIKRRCWAECGLAGIQNVLTGEQADRMETFFLSETAKYLFLLFTPDHPLHSLDRNFVFSTEGHPLILPRRAVGEYRTRSKHKFGQDDIRPQSCPAPVSTSPFFSSVASRPDFFHASELAKAELTSPLRLKTPLSTYLSSAGVQSPNNFSTYPWTLPTQYIPSSGVSSTFEFNNVINLVFPHTAPSVPGAGLAKRVHGGILINPSRGFRMSMVRERTGSGDVLRVDSVSTMMIGRDENVFFPQRILKGLDPENNHFRGFPDSKQFDIVLDISSGKDGNSCQGNRETEAVTHCQKRPLSNSDLIDTIASVAPLNGETRMDESLFGLILEKIRTLLPTVSSIHEVLNPNRLHRVTIPAYLQAAFPGPQSASSPLPDSPPSPVAPSLEDENILDELSREQDSVFPYFSNLPLHKICFAPSFSPSSMESENLGSDAAAFESDLPLSKPTLSCVEDIPIEMASGCHVIVVNLTDRSPCSVERQLSFIPSVPRTESSVRLVVILAQAKNVSSIISPTSRLSGEGTGLRSYADLPPIPSQSHEEDSDVPSREVLEKLIDLGIHHPRPLPVLVVDQNPNRIWNLLKSAEGLGVRRRWQYWSSGMPITNLVIV